MAADRPLPLQSKTQSIITVDKLKLGEPGFHRLYAKGEAGLGGSRGAVYSANTLGAGLGISGGAFLTPRWSGGLFYKSAWTSTGNISPLLGDASLAQMYGIESDYSVIKSESDELRAGAKIARVSVDAAVGVLFIPVIMTPIKSWGFGPTVGYFHFFVPQVGIGLEASYMQVLASSTTSHTAIGDYASSIPTFGSYDVSLSLQLRFL